VGGFGPIDQASAPSIGGFRRIGRTRFGFDHESDSGSATHEPETGYKTMTVPMSDLKHGQRGQVLQLHGAGSLRDRLLDLGLVPGTSIAGDPICYLVRGAMIALRSGDASRIQVRIAG
jgi:ferrous iron transport protein A